MNPYLNGPGTNPDQPVPTNPTPGESPIEIDTGDLHSKPGVEFDTIPDSAPFNPSPDVPNEPETPTEPNRETPAPPPGH